MFLLFVVIDCHAFVFNFQSLRSRVVVQLQYIAWPDHGEYIQSPLYVRLMAFAPTSLL